MNQTSDDSLASKKCIPCHGGVSALGLDEAKKMLSQLSSPGAGNGAWQIVENGKALKSEFKFVDFYRAMSFVNAVAHVANAEDHHPDIECGWGYVRIRYQTHSIDGLHENDFICAAKINALPKV